jgi:hypothetical protein
MAYSPATELRSRCASAGSKASGTPVVWDSEFDTGAAAYAEFLRSVEIEGLEGIFRNPRTLH